MPATSVGVIITNRTVFLACHSTGNTFYDLPKGMPEEGETPEQTACREVREESGLNILPDQIKDLGVFPYNRAKNLHLFLWTTESLPPIEEMACTSTFIDRYSGQAKPEVDGYEYIGFDQAVNMMTANMARVIRDAERRIREIS
ncbi:NUDIX domain-containing protein [Paenibacillus sp. OAE614]